LGAFALGVTFLDRTVFALIPLLMGRGREQTFR